MTFPRQIIVPTACTLMLFALAALTAYRLYGDARVSQGVSTDFRKGQPCDSSSANPCPTP